MDVLADLLGNSSKLVAVREQVRRLLSRQGPARRLPPVLIQGETGTGKGLLARAMHRASPRAAGSFVNLNCAAIPETLLEAELFGFERGAFTDARHGKAGLFQAADRGTLFLDEVALLPEGVQGKLLTVIEEQVVRRLGSTRSEQVDVWVVTAASEDLASAVQARRFREDLYHRLAVVTLTLPPLRERGRDIMLLAEHALARACADYGLPPLDLASDAKEAIRAYPWPGNVRELANTMERVALLSEGTVVTARMLQLSGPASIEPRVAAPAPSSRLVDDVLRAHVHSVLRETEWNLSRAAGGLGVARNTLMAWIEKYGLRRDVKGGPSRGPRPRPRTAASTTEASVSFPPVRRPLGLAWERRRLVLLRAVLESTTDSAAPEASGALERVRDKVQSFGGRIEEMSPLGAVATFGLEPLEDAPRRAALAALAIRSAVADDSTGSLGRLAVRIALHTGEFLIARAADVPAMDEDAKSEARAFLRALVQRAPRNEVVVSEALAPLLDRWFDLAPGEDADASTLRVYHLSGAGRLAGFGTRPISFVGRHGEMDVLRSGLDSVLAGRGQVVGIVGQAGIGKSRLLYEFRHHVGDRVRYLEGHCRTWGTEIPYLPVLEILRTAGGLAESDGPGVIAQKLRRSLDGSRMDAARAVSYLLRLLGVREGTEESDEVSPDAIQSGMFEILRHIILRQSERRPLIVAIEDLHWVDRVSEAYLLSLVEHLVSLPIMLLTTHRPGYSPPWIEKSYVTQVALQPLGQEESLRVVRGVLRRRTTGDDVAAQILARAEGNPLFLEELARNAREAGERGPDVSVPATIQQVLLARIDRLPDRSKRLLQTASILGREVSLGLVRAICDDPDTLEQDLRELIRRELLGHAVTSGEPMAVFKHTLTHEVTYETLPASRRRTLHAAAGAALETVYRGRLEEVYDRLAYHYGRSAEDAKAIDYLTRFAEKAAWAANARAEAIVALRGARGRAERLPEGEQQDRCVLDLALREAASLNFLMRFRETLELLAAEQARLDRLGDSRLTGMYHFWLARTYGHRGDNMRTVEHARRALDEARRCDDKLTMGGAHYVLAVECYWSGDFVAGIEHAQQAISLLEPRSHRSWLSYSYWALGFNYMALGEFDRALEADARADAIADDTVDCRRFWTRGMIYAFRGDGQAAIDACRESRERSSDPLNAAMTLASLGHAHLEQGNPVEALPLLERSMQRLHELGYRQAEAWVAVLVSEALLGEGKREAAREPAWHALRLATERGFPYGVAYARRVLGRVARAEGHAAEAKTQLEEALEIFSSIQAGFEVGRTKLALADLAHAQGDDAGATALLEAADAIFTSLAVPAWATRTRQLAQEVSSPASQDPTGSKET